MVLTNFAMKLFVRDITSRCELLRGAERSKLRRKSWSSKFDGARKCFRERFGDRRDDDDKEPTKMFSSETIDEKAEDRRISQEERTGSSGCENRIKLLTEWLVHPRNDLKFHQTIAYRELSGATELVGRGIVCRSYVTHLLKMLDKKTHTLNFAFLKAILTKRVNRVYSFNINKFDIGYLLFLLTFLFQIFVFSFKKRKSCPLKMSIFNLKALCAFI